jgi:sec-independent protein translocase protein TatB
MFDIAWSELLVIMVVALVVIGPKDLPRALKVAGTWVRRARGIAAQFQGTVDAMVREADMQDVRRDLRKAQQDFETFSTDPGPIPAGTRVATPAEGTAAIEVQAEHAMMPPRPMEAPEAIKPAPDAETSPPPPNAGSTPS